MAAAEPDGEPPTGEAEVVDVDEAADGMLDAVRGEGEPIGAVAQPTMLTARPVSAIATGRSIGVRITVPLSPSNRSVVRADDSTRWRPSNNHRPRAKEQ